MIYTITLNPALDRTLQVSKIKDDVSNRILRENFYAGGKGIDVSRVLTHLGVENRAQGFRAGFAGEHLKALLIKEGVQSDFIRVSGETRTNIIIHEIETERQVAFNSRGPEVKPFEIIQLTDTVTQLDDPEMVIIGGSLPQGAHPEIYRRIIRTLKIRGAKVVLDVDREALKLGIQAKPNIIKPNIHELSHLVGRELNKMDDILEAAREIHKGGVEIVLVSMGAKGILLVTEGKEYLAEPPQVKVVNTIGAGDSSVAGFVYCLIVGKGLKECVAYAAAAGTATTLKRGTALCQREEIEMLVPQVKLKVLLEE